MARNAWFIAAQYFQRTFYMPWTHFVHSSGNRSVSVALSPVSAVQQIRCVCVCDRFPPPNMLNDQSHRNSITISCFNWFRWNTINIFKLYAIQYMAFFLLSESFVIKIYSNNWKVFVKWNEKKKKLANNGTPVSDRLSLIIYIYIFRFGKNQCNAVRPWLIVNCRLYTEVVSFWSGFNCM